VNDTIPLTMRRLTPGEVLGVLRHVHAIYSIDGDPDLPIRFETTVADYRQAVGFHGELIDPPLGPILNQLFSIDCADDEWVVFMPENRRTLREVCELISTRAEVPALIPATVLGRPCLSAGAFLAVKSVLTKKGADVSRLAPLSPVEPYLFPRGQSFYEEVAKLAPGAVPMVRWHRHPAPPLIGLTLLSTFLGSALLLLFVSREWAAVNFLIGVAVIFGHATLAPKPRLEIPGVETFRDLVGAMLRPRTPVPQP
jgi:hypothetical protein